MHFAAKMIISEPLTAQVIVRQYSINSREICNLKYVLMLNKSIKSNRKTVLCFVVVFFRMSDSIQPSPVNAVASTAISSWKGSWMCKYETEGQASKKRMHRLFLYTIGSLPRNHRTISPQKRPQKNQRPTALPVTILINSIPVELIGALWKEEKIVGARAFNMILARA